MPRCIPNQFPLVETPSKLAIIGSGAVHEDIEIGKPFSSYRGNGIANALRKANLASTSVFKGYLRNFEHFARFNPPKSKPDLEFNEDEQASIALLKRDLAQFNPNIILLLGPELLYLAGIREHSLEAFRGSLFVCADTNSPFFGYKCIATFDPDRLRVDYSSTPIFNFDVNRAVRESYDPELKLPVRIFELELTSRQIIDRLEAIQPGQFVSIDIEGGIPNPEATSPDMRFPNGATCIGISTGADKAFIIPLQDLPGSEQAMVMLALDKVLGNPNIPKILQNGLYDAFVLFWLWRVRIKCIAWDTMLGAWELYPELEKSLAMQTSLFTRQPYYKFQRSSQDTLTKYGYCCMDAAVTYEIAMIQMMQLEKQPKALEHFKFNMSLLPPLLYMEFRGILYDKEQAAKKLEEVSLEMSLLQTSIDKDCGINLNINSHVQMKRVFYEIKGFERQYKKEHGRKTDKLTTDVDALLNLYIKTQSVFVRNVLMWRQLEGQRRQLTISADADGRARSASNIVGTDTGRLSNKESPTGSGANLTTIMKSLRNAFIADEEMWMAECDLEGADGWTVAAHCKAQGDPTMWDDYMAGIKPALVIAAMYLHGNSVNRLSREELKILCDKTKKEAPKWLYPACKAVQHGSNYVMGINTMSVNILKKSWKEENNPIYVSPRDCGKLQYLYMDVRYTGLKDWQNKYVKRQLEDAGKLPSASGHTRIFFGRRNDNNTLRTACSQEPQMNTTYVTMRALSNLWNDEENYDGRRKPIIDPLLPIHDALLFQFPKARLDWALPKIRSYFDITITIAGIEVKIPFSGHYGKSWSPDDLIHKI